ncbi:hypothetical protein [Burkholderia cepacia]|uniref:hypothetical protein n=1 Tax=Burkholderia cepacia TaxID=292 RepID=UPI0018C4988E|nr:hypothetical protein [Burkholderia cepacia]
MNKALKLTGYACAALFGLMLLVGIFRNTTHNEGAAASTVSAAAAARSDLPVIASSSKEVNLLSATIWVALGAIVAAFITREVKISEFRQAWINDLRDDLAEYIKISHKWIDLYLVYNDEGDQRKKRDMAPKLDKEKYDALHLLSRIRLRFKPNDEAANKLLDDLGDLLNPGKLHPDNKYSSWRSNSDAVIYQARFLLKEEWETTKNPLRKLKRKFEVC